MGEPGLGIFSSDEDFHTKFLLMNLFIFELATVVVLDSAWKVGIG